MDNFLRPVLIRARRRLAAAAHLRRVIVGLQAFGLVGIFVGPVVLAVAYTLLMAWIADSEPAA